MILEDFNIDLLSAFLEYFIEDNAEQNGTEQPNLSDVLDVLEEAERHNEAAGVCAAAGAVVCEGAGAVVCMSSGDMAARPSTTQMVQPCVRIVEQPASKALRFRYECEGRSAGSIPGVNSTPENRTYPTIKILGYKGPVTIVVSCVTKDGDPYKPHPHNLVGRDRCDRGVCTVRTEITEENNEYQFRNLGIQCVKRRDIGEALKAREELRVDPFRTGFSHRNNPQSMDLNAVRLAFQVFVAKPDGRMRWQLPTVASDVIYDKKAMSDLQIMRASHCSGTVRGGNHVILLCEKVTREEVVVVFYEDDKNDQILWEEPAITLLVHRQCAIAFETPPYRNPHIADNVKVKFQLKRTTDNARSNSLPFEYIAEFIGRKRKPPLPSLSSYNYDSFPVEQKVIKAEPNKTPPHRMSTSPLNVYSPPQYAADPQPPWQIQGNLPVPGPSHLAPFQHWPQAQYEQAVSPVGPSVPYTVAPSPMLAQMGQGMVSPMPTHALSPGQASPLSNTMSPYGHTMSPGQASPYGQSLSPGHAVSPLQEMDSVQNIVQLPPSYTQQVAAAQNPMDSQQNSTSLSRLLEMDCETDLNINSAELSSLSSFLQH